MRTFLRSLPPAALALLWCGCLPEESVWWSPDGQTAAVRTSEGLRLAGPDGRLSPVLLSGAIQFAHWSPDGSGLVVSRSLERTNWAAVEALIPAEEAAATRTMARAMPDLLRAGLTVADGTWNDLEERFLKPLGLGTSAALSSAWLCALDLHRQALLEVVRGFTNRAALEAELFAPDASRMAVHEILWVSRRDGRWGDEPRTLVRSLGPLLDPVLAPRHPVLAFRTGAGALKVLPLGAGSPVTVADEAVVTAVWSADGRSLIHVVMEESETVGEIRSRPVLDERGELLTTTPPTETLALAAFGAGASPRLAALPDGRLLFASVPVTLPARAGSIHPGARFFLLDPAAPEASLVAVPIREGSLPDDLSVFALSPDGQRVAMVEAGTDAVAVLELETGKVSILSPAHEGWKSRLIPAWRSPQELSFAALPSPTAPRPELMLWRADSPRNRFSDGWPDNVVQPWLEGPGASSETPAP
jgi:hypothetical protein